jgi:hypothetical protein
LLSGAAEVTVRAIHLAPLVLFGIVVGCSSSSGVSSSVPARDAVAGGGSGGTGGGTAGTGTTGGTATATGGGFGGTGSGGGAAVPVPAVGGGSTDVSAGGGGDGGIPADVLTAGAWDDNRNYSFFTSYLATNASLSGVPPISPGDQAMAAALFAGDRAPKQRLDIAIVLDTTGSMTDEAPYLSGEFQNITAAIASAFPNSDQRWGLVAYRDRPDTDPGDEYVVRSWDFMTDLSAYRGTVAALTAGGGGDNPEAPDLGLAAGNALSWRTDADVARLMFWVADAPHHDQYAAAMAQDFADARSNDIHLYPVSASGSDDLLEYTMRSGAQVTGGRYLFLTDDSGIGDPHLIPPIPCYFVTRLGKAIVRMASIELSGTYVAPDPADIVRVDGNPVGGQCADGNGGMVSVF